MNHIIGFDGFDDGPPERDSYDKYEGNKAIDELCRVNKLLHDATPGGSEFANDPDFCVEYLLDRNNRMFKFIKEYIVRNRELEAENKRMMEALKRR